MTINNWLLTPPIAFSIILFTTILLVYLFSKLSFKSKTHTAGSKEPYACGEDNYNNMAHPDYSIFFPFAFFFTIAHVGTLIITTIPVATLKNLNIAALYIVGLIVGLTVLLRK